MSDTKINLARKPRSLYSIQPKHALEVVCHRRKAGTEQFLVIWREEHGAHAPKAVCSWHALDELSRSLHLVQTYLESLKRSKITQNTSKITQKPLSTSLLQPTSLKRKSPGSDPVTSRDNGLGILTPNASSDRSRAASVISIASSSDDNEDEPNVYNGILERKDGWIVAKKLKHPRVVEINASTLPTRQMREEASRVPTPQAERAIREAFHQKVKHVPNLSLENRVDSSTPSLNFKFVEDYVPGDGVYRADAETLEGCQKPCRPNMGQNCGCEYTALCSCLEYAAVNEHKFKDKEPERYEQYQEAKTANEFFDTSGLPKRFPYSKARGENDTQALVEFYLNSRNPIYECNAKCNCGPMCKSRVVQKGRRVPLSIFKTANRGWGLKCKDNLDKGQFIDVYLGEIITNDEADRRESHGSKEKASYLYSLDKFVGDHPDLTEDNCYVVDGQYVGGPTRFINHSCEPNCRQFTVSYNKHDLRVYDLAFFAIEPIPKGTELTFDYMNGDEQEEDDALRKREEAANDPGNLDKVRCNCGARKCRGYLWV